MFTPQSLQTRSSFTVGVGNVILALTYYGMAEVSRAIASTPEQVTPVWPPDGIAMASILLFGHQFLPGIFTGSFLANIWAFWPDNGGFLEQVMAIGAVLGIALGTTLGTAFAIATWRRTTALPSPNPFLHLGPTVKFLIYGGFCGPGINATIGVAMLVQLQVVSWTDYGASWFTWWFSNMAGVWIVSPLLICWYYWFQRSWREQGRYTDPQQGRPTLRWTHQRTLEVGMLAGLVVMIGHGAFWGDRPFAYMLMPLLVWATFRFGPVGSTSVTAIAAAIAIGGTVNGKGSFTHTARACGLTDSLCHTNANLQHLQAFIVVIAFTTLILVSILEERKADARKLTTLIDELETTNQYLEERVSFRTEELRDKNQQLADALHTLRNTQSKVIQTEKMIGLGQIVAGISHEFNNPLSVIAGNLKYLEGYTQDFIKMIQLYGQTYPNATPSIQQYLDTVDLPFLCQDLPNILRSMETGTTRMESIVASLRSFSRLDEAYAKAVNVHEGLDSTLLLLHYRCQDTRGQTIRITKDYGNLPLVECYPGELNQVFLYLLTNAIDAFDDIGVQGDRRLPTTSLPAETTPPERSKASNSPPHIHIRTKMDGDQWVVIAIADNGPGIPTDIQVRMFEPFFSTKPIGKGTGMGLAISYQIVTETHSGELTCISSADNGTEFIIRIPCQIDTENSNK